MLLGSIAKSAASSRHEESEEPFLNTKVADCTLERATGNENNERRLEQIVAVQWFLIIIISVIAAVSWFTSLKRCHFPQPQDQVYCENKDLRKRETHY